ncbi:response regulator transcription factor [Panacibacter sp. DH6]|uniref:Response regulator transcription factor n=1 Tax=Panacibacter microcysteis TaxID=2793269 RepID=A0A931E6S9_9BACT|nr:response regulator [Panacibacter microcysteis]MBG9376325.1 response regulator transcription factor [Panacibacter microcysteis]
MENKVLICDDDEGILDLLTLVLAAKKINAVTERNSANIFEKITQEQPSVVILDLWMPVLSGEQIVKKLKLNAQTKDLPVIIFSASIDGKKIAHDAGADEFLEKPFDLKKLLDKVNVHLRH